MDQPTNLEITIKGKAEDVKKAALAAQKRIDADTNGFDENAYVIDAVDDFEEILDEAIGMLGDYGCNELDDGTAEYHTEQESYGCIFEDDIMEIGKAIAAAAPDVEAHISAVITITYAEGYDLCVDVDYQGGELSMETLEEYYEGWEDEDDDWAEDEEE